MKYLIAVFPILFESQNYKPGDKLPTHNTGFVEAWIKNGAAVWREDEERKKQVVKAKSITAPVGLLGDAYPSAGLEQDLIGKPSSRKIRGAQPEPSKGRRKSHA
ncbi:MAG: hypothetical protein K1V96_04280 [Lachnospiraceae bacterium]